MKRIDLSLAADVFWTRRGRRGLQFKRFATLAEAVRFVIEDETELRSACSIETDEAHFSREEIAALYASMATRPTGTADRVLAPLHRLRS